MFRTDTQPARVSSRQQFCEHHPTAPATPGSPPRNATARRARRRWVMLLLTLALLLTSLVADPPAPAGAELTRPEDVVAVLSPDINTYWYQVSAAAGFAQYYHAPAHIYWYDTPTQPGPGRGACGTLPVQNSLYCLRDQSIYLDYQFLQWLIQQRGDFAAGFVLAHEWGHHVQTVLGLRSASTLQQELQADCFAGTYSRSAATRDVLEPGDPEEAYRFALASGGMGGDHGTGEQRAGWFAYGYRTGEPGSCQP